VLHSRYKKACGGLTCLNAIPDVQRRLPGPFHTRASIAIRNPIASANYNKTHCGIRNFKKREDLRRELREEPRDDSVSDRCAVNVAPLQLGQDVLWIHLV
jgi:hypothetical protein